MLEIEAITGQKIVVEPRGCPHRAMRRVAVSGCGYEHDGRLVWLPAHQISRIVLLPDGEKPGNCLCGVCDEDDEQDTPHPSKPPAASAAAMEPAAVTVQPAPRRRWWRWLFFGLV